jgi:hypothetical protein
MAVESTTRTHTIAEHDVIVVPVEAAKPSRRDTAARAFIVAVILLGVLGRVGAFVRNPSLWIDEAMLALNVVHRTPSQLLQPLDLNQGAPVGFLLVSKFVVANFGSSEYALRAVPLLASLVGLGVFVLFAYRVLPLAAARLAIVLYSLSPYLIGYAAEFKQYGLDATICLSLAAIARSERKVALALAGALAVWFSHPAAFVLASIGCVMLAEVARTRKFSPLLILAAWLVSFALCYLLILRKLGINEYLLNYWAGAFLPMPPVKPGDVAWIVHHVFQLFEKPGGFAGELGLGGFACVCYLVGVLTWAKHDWRLVALLVLPMFFALVASGLRRYPFAGRLMLFAVPLMIPLVAVGAITMADRLRDLGRTAWWLIVVTVCLGSLSECNTLRKMPLHAEETRELIGELAAKWQPGDRVYVYYGAVPAFAYYHLRYPLPREAVTFGVENRGKDTRQFQKELETLRGHSRVWVLLAHRQPTDEAAIRAYLDSLGSGTTMNQRNDAVLLLYDLSEPER